MKRLKILSLVLVVLMPTAGCKKECDFHLKFLGKYRFEVRTDNWNINTGETWDTTFFDGEIALYQTGDEYLDESYENQQPGVINDGKLTVEFLPNVYLLSAVTKEGDLSPESGYHYHHEGHFDANGDVTFQITGRGGLGLGWNYYVTGKRIE
jgi:hypothetical protein